MRFAIAFDFESLSETTSTNTLCSNELSLHFAFCIWILTLSAWVETVYTSRENVFVCSVGWDATVVGVCVYIKSAEHTNINGNQVWNCLFLFQALSFSWVVCASVCIARDRVKCAFSKCALVFALFITLPISVASAPIQAACFACWSLQFGFYDTAASHMVFIIVRNFHTWTGWMCISSRWRAVIVNSMTYPFHHRKNTFSTKWNGFAWKWHWNGKFKWKQRTSGSTTIWNNINNSVADEKKKEKQQNKNPTHHITSNHLFVY